MFLFYFIKKNTTFLVNSESIIFGIENNVCFGFIVLDLFGMKGFIFKVRLYVFVFIFIYLFGECHFSLIKRCSFSFGEYSELFWGISGLFDMNFHCL